MQKIYKKTPTTFIFSLLKALLFSANTKTLGVICGPTYRGTYTVNYENSFRCIQKKRENIGFAGYQIDG